MKILVSDFRVGFRVKIGGEVGVKVKVRVRVRVRVGAGLGFTIRVRDYVEYKGCDGRSIQPSRL